MVESGDEVWVLDLVGYDTGGGMARIFSTPEKAMASLDANYDWGMDKEGNYKQELNYPESLDGVWVIYKRKVDDDGE